MELHKQFIPIDWIKQAKEDVLANKDKAFPGQNRVNLSEIKSKAIEEIAQLCGALAWHEWRPKNSGAQIHEKREESAQTWHQDIVALGGAAGCTIWVPLDPIDGTRPTMLFAGEMKAQNHNYDERVFSTAVLKEPIASATIVLEMALGDIAMFSWSELHRTWWTPDMVNGRVSLDLRYAPGV